MFSVDAPSSFSDLPEVSSVPSMRPQLDNIWLAVGCEIPLVSIRLQDLGILSKEPGTISLVVIWVSTLASVAIGFAWSV